MNIDKTKTVAITGYGLTDILETSLELNLLSNLLRQISKEIVGLYNSGYTTFMCSMNEGFELMVADTVMKLKNDYPQIELIAVIPFQGHERRYSSPDRYRYKRIMENANTTIVISDSENNSAYSKLNDLISSNSSSVLCYCNGKHYATETVYNQAIANGTPTINLCVESEEIC